ncbi:CAAX protease [Alkalihalobacillus pseudalcaliphilus]|nr:CAAX protease [Alkalihalobacillus pseudalcaliphilus]
MASSLLFISFTWQPLSFWMLFSISYVLLILIALLQSKPVIPLHHQHGWLVAFIGGIGIYLLFAIGKAFLILFQIPLLESLEQLYQLVQPNSWIQWLCLFIIIIPGEELFWRYYVLNRALVQFSPQHSILLATLLYSAVHLFSGSILLVLAAFIAGFIWNVLYYYTKNIFAVIWSHIVFNICLLILFPLL